VRDDQVIEIVPLVNVDEVHQGELDLHGILGVDQAKEVRDAGDMGVDGYSRDVVTVTQDTVGCLASHTRQRDEVVKCCRYFTTEPVDEFATARLNVLGLVAKETSGTNVLLQFLLRHSDKVLRRSILLEQGNGDDVHAFIRALRRQNGGDQQLERRGPVQADTGVRISFAKSINDRCRPPPESLCLLRTTCHG